MVLELGETALESIVHGVSGFCAGSSGILVAQPFDTIRVRIAASRFHVTASKEFLDLVRHEGITALYRGIIPPLMSSGLISMIGFTTMEHSRKIYSTFWPHLGGGLITYMAGVTSGVFVSFVSSPNNLLKIQLQTTRLAKVATALSNSSVTTNPSTAVSPAWSNGQKHSAHTIASQHANNTVARSTWSLVRATWQYGGLRGFYRCLGLQMLVESLGRGFYFTAYDQVKRAFVRYNASKSNVCKNDQVSSASMKNKTESLGNIGQNLTLWQRILSGACAGISGWTLVYPLDVVKTRMMSQIQYELNDAMNPHRKDTHCTVGRYKNMIDCIKRSYQEEGIRVFSRGWGVTVLRSIPVSATSLVIYDLVHAKLSHMLHTD